MTLLQKFRTNSSNYKNVRNRSKGDVKYVNAMLAVIHWCSEQGITVKFAAQISGCDLAENIITINSRLVSSTQFYQLLHECGHYIIKNNFSNAEINRRFSRIQYEYETCSKTAAIEQVDEEFEAWNQGQILAENLKLDIDTEAFSRHKAKSIISYMKLALDV